MGQIAELQLGERGRAFIVGELARGKRLSRFAVEGIDFRQGQVVTRLPVGVTRAASLEFESQLLPDARRVHRGNWTFAEAQSLDDVLASTLGEFLLLGTSRRCVFEDQSATAGAPYLKKSGHRVFTCGDDVYHVLKPGDDLGVMLSTLRLARSWLLTGFLVRGDAAFAHEVTREFSMDDLRQLVNDCEAVIVGAYDGDGFVLWRRDEGQVVQPR